MARKGEQGGRYVVGLTKSRMLNIGVCAAAMAVSGIYGWAQNSAFFPDLAGFFPAGREINSFIRIALFALAFAVAHMRPSAFDMRTISIATCASIVCSAALLVLATTFHISLMIVMGLVFFEAGHIWSILMMGIAFCRLPSPRDAAIAVGLGFFLGDLFIICLPPLSLDAGLAVMAICAIGMLGLTYKQSKSTIEIVSQGEPVANMEITDPHSFLKPTHVIYACILLFNVASGFALTLNEVNDAPTHAMTRTLVVLAVTLWFLRKGNENEGADLLFSFAVLLVIAGFLAAILLLPTQETIANELIRSGAACFSILVWVVLASIGRRNAFAIIPTLALANIAQDAGIVVGAILGHTINDLGITTTGAMPGTAGIAASVVLFGFLAFLWLGLRKFSFEGTIQDIESPTVSRKPEEESIDTEQARSEASIEQRCRNLGKRHGLTEREIEIFALLARGRNSTFIQEHYVISRNTAKTHVKRIYKKLDVHSHQELIDMVESIGAEL